MKASALLFTALIGCSLSAANAQSNLSLSNYTFSATQPVMERFRENPRLLSGG